MAADANPPGRGADETRFLQISRELADSVDAVLPAWIEGLVVTRVQQWRGSVSEDVHARAASAGERARAAVMPELRALLSTDPDEQRSNPLAVLRGATGFAGEVLADLGAPPVARDEFSERSFPHDTYDLVPATWGDVDPTLHEIGITWGAAKAFVHKARRRDEHTN